MDWKEFVSETKLLALQSQTEFELLQKRYAFLQEQKEKLVEWLEKKIEVNQKRLDWQKSHGEIMFSAQICEGLEQRIADLKEVLVKVGEQK